MEKVKVQLAQHYNIYYHNIKQYENNTDLTKRYMGKKYEYRNDEWSPGEILSNQLVQFVLSVESSVGI